jgi:alpha,alpha-trehalase
MICRTISIALLTTACTLTMPAIAQPPQPPNVVYGKLFTDVQLSGIFKDGKTFVDCVPRKAPKDIVAAYEQVTSNPAIRFSLQRFVEENFIIPPQNPVSYKPQQGVNILQHIDELWTALLRKADVPVEGSSLLPLPSGYIVPGGRFREVYYWDSYFTMLGLAESNQWKTIENMVDNFTYLITNYGHIPNGNRTYYLSRSQPPFFSLMVQLLAQKNGGQVYATYQNALQKEYDYWMDKSNAATKHVVKMPDGSLLNRYYDVDDEPRQESFKEDYELVEKAPEAKQKELARHLRSGAESGWDFSSRWFANGKTLETIETTNIVPVDLNGLLYQLEMVLSQSYKTTGDLLQSQLFQKKALARKNAVLRYCYSPTQKLFMDYHLITKKHTQVPSLAGVTPLFFGMATQRQADEIATTIHKKFLRKGGVVTTLNNTGQQWDAPNGWAPMQYMTVEGLAKYNKNALANDIAKRWLNLNIKVYQRTGKLMEKYNVEDDSQLAGGGEYPGQDGFGWTNGVFLALVNKYK